MKKRYQVAFVKAFTLLFCANLLIGSTGCASKGAENVQTASSEETEIPNAIEYNSFEPVSEKEKSGILTLSLTMSGEKPSKTAMLWTSI